MPYYSYTYGEELEEYKKYYAWLKGSHGKTADTPYMLPKKYQSVFCKKH